MHAEPLSRTCKHRAIHDLGSISPVRRGIPQIEDTLDIDASGMIMKVGAADSNKGM